MESAVIAWAPVVFKELIHEHLAMNAHTLQVLEYEKVKGVLSGFAVTELGREAVHELAPKTDLQVVKKELDEVSEMRNILFEGSSSLLEGARDLTPLLRKSSLQGSHLSAKELLSCGHTMRSARLAKESLEERGEACPNLLRLSHGIRPSPQIEERIVSSIDESGEIRDSASEKLRELRSKRRSIELRVKETLGSIIDERRGSIQEPIITLRDERYVIPVKSVDREKIEGIVHNISATGATLFVEPLAVFELNNEIKRAALEEKEEEERVLHELTGLIREEREGIEETLTALKAIDLVYAKARFSLEFDCSTSCLNENGRICLREGRHPLLILRKGGPSGVVPLDLELGRDFTTLLLTGPNSGGKTVALKTVGLLTLMVQSGMHIPASPDSELGVFPKIYADIGDEQSIEEDLSSFSSHLQNVLKVLEDADSETLVFLDEIGGSTDPEEGSSLAMALLDELTSRGVRTVATTHYGRLKVFVHSQERMENGGMEFDINTNLPTYRLKIGLPGRSNALQIAGKLGVSRPILERARAFLDSDGLKMDRLIVDLEEALGEAEEERGILVEKREALEKVLGEERKKLEELQREERREKSRIRREARSILEETRAKCENLVREIRESQANSKAIKEFRDTIETEYDRLKEKPLPSGRDELQVGDPVLVETLNLRGTLLSLSKETGRVEVGGVKVEVPIGLLRKGIKEEKSSSYRVRFSQDRDVAPQLDLRGLRAEEAEKALTRYLDDLQIVGLSSFRIIHGMGTGALRKIVEETLRADPRVKSFRLGELNEGGEGVTIGELTGCENPPK